jgi:ABC-type branched-subunit amino acid transport system ATPase component
LSANIRIIFFKINILIINVVYLHYNINLKKAVLFIGLPGSGKTTIVNKVYGDYNIVSADIIKSTHRL